MAEEDDEKARAEAEARRQRILQKGKDRMNIVAGLQEEADADDEETKASGAARMAAMRRRRFKKNKATEAAAAAPEATTETKEEEATAPAPVAAEEKPPATEKKPEKKDPVPVVETTKDEPAAATEEEETATDGEPKKKYKGVAKMRRAKMMQKKKEEAAKSEEDFKNASDSPAVQARRQKKLKQPVLPILMYLFTTFLLFLAGLDVGLQHADDTIIVNRDFAPKQFTFQKLNPWSSKKSTIKNLESDSNDAYARGLSEQDEFHVGGDDADDDYVPNIDPLFQVDLDELTSGPGILPQLARGAVKIHRMFLYIPLQVFSLPRHLLKFPPVMCLVALTLRQVVAKLVLGAKLPENIEEDVRNSKEMTDVLTMIKNAVKSTVSSTFPTAVSMFEGFQHLRADMYVMLCGVFVGLLYSSWMIQETSTAGLEEDLLPPEPVDGMADEL